MNWDWKCEPESWDGEPSEDSKIRVPGLGTLTRRGEVVLALLLIVLFIGAMAIVGGVEQ